MADSLKFIAYYDFLRKVPSTSIERLPQEERECLLCRGPYDPDTSKWAPGKTYHYPVTIPCGRHHIGFDCLVQWMLSPNFDNHCSLDRTEIVPHLQQRSLQRAFQREDHVLIAMLFGWNSRRFGDSRTLLLQMMEKFTRRDPATVANQGEGDRILMLYEEFIDRFATGEHVVRTLPRGFRLRDNVLDGHPEVFRELRRGRAVNFDGLVLLPLSMLGQDPPDRVPPNNADVQM